MLLQGKNQLLVVLKPEAELREEPGFARAEAMRRIEQVFDYLCLLDDGLMHIGKRAVGLREGCGHPSGLKRGSELQKPHLELRGGNRCVSKTAGAQEGKGCKNAEESGYQGVSVWPRNLFIVSGACTNSMKYSKFRAAKP